MLNCNLKQNHYFATKNGILEVSVYNSPTIPFDVDNPIYYCLEYDKRFSIINSCGLFRRGGDIFEHYSILQDMGTFPNVISLCKAHNIPLSLAERLRLAIPSRTKEPPISL